MKETRRKVEESECEKINGGIESGEENVSEVKR